MAGSSKYTIVAKNSEVVEDLEEFAINLFKEEESNRHDAESYISILEKGSGIVVYYSRKDIVEEICKEFKGEISGVGKVSAETTYGSVNFIGYNVNDDGSLERVERDSKDSFPLGYSHRWKGASCPAPEL